MNQTHRNGTQRPFQDDHIGDQCQISAFRIEDVVTHDAVPLNVDAIVFWHTHDVTQAALAFPEGRQSIRRTMLATLHEAIGMVTLTALLYERAGVDARLCDELGRRMAGSGVTVRRVGIQGVAVPAAVQAERDAGSLVALYLCRPRQAAQSPPVCDGRQTSPRTSLNLH